MARYYICGQVGSGTEADPYRPEIADEVPAEFGWAANQEFATLIPQPLPAPRFMVNVASADQAALDAWHAQVAYAKTTNPNGYDWLEVHEDGTVSVHAA